MPPRSRRLHRSHFLLDPLNRTSPEPKRLGDLEDADTLLELLLRLAFQGDVDLGPSEPCTLRDSTFEAALIRCRIIDLSNSANAWSRLAPPLCGAFSMNGTRNDKRALALRGSARERDCDPDYALRRSGDVIFECSKMEGRPSKR